MYFGRKDGSSSQYQQIFFVFLYKGSTETGETIIKSTARQDLASCQFQLGRTWDTAYDKYNENVGSVLGPLSSGMLPALLSDMLDAGQLTEITMTSAIEMQWPRKITDSQVVDHLNMRKSSPLFTIGCGLLGELRGHDDFLPEVLHGTDAFFQLPFTISSNVSNRSIYKSTIDDTPVRSSDQHTLSDGQNGNVDLSVFLKSIVPSSAETFLVDLEKEQTVLITFRERIRVAWLRENGEIILLIRKLPILQGGSLSSSNTHIISNEKFPITAYYGPYILQERFKEHLVNAKLKTDSYVSELGQIRKMKSVEEERVTVNHNVLLSSIPGATTTVQEIIEFRQTGTVPRANGSSSYMIPCFLDVTDQEESTFYRLVNS